MQFFEWRKRKVLDLKPGKTCEMEETEMKTVMGYEFDDALEFNDSVLYVLALLRRRGAVSFYMDGSVEMDETVQQLEEAAVEGYFTVFRQGHHIVVIETDRFNCDDV